MFKILVAVLMASVVLVYASGYLAYMGLYSVATPMLVTSTVLFIIGQIGTLILGYQEINK